MLAGGLWAMRLAGASPGRLARAAGGMLAGVLSLCPRLPTGVPRRPAVFRAMLRLRTGRE
jgi:hypothetical protein